MVGWMNTVLKARIKFVVIAYIQSHIFNCYWLGLLVAAFVP
jgi:hypothetical protein